jgi:hypothetical protein
MYCATINLTPILQAGQFWEVVLNGVNQANQTVNNFTLCGLGGSNEIKIRRVKANGAPCEYSIYNLDI